MPEYTGDLAYTSGELALKPAADCVTSFSSFVRSVSMDTWQEEQIKRMQVCFDLVPMSRGNLTTGIACRQRPVQEVHEELSFGTRRVERGNEPV